jgi:selenocysteine lyase/cysteine desulfurase
MAALACLLGTQVQAIYEKERGLNDWHIENIGEILNLKFVEPLDDEKESDTVYIISKNGLLSLFNTDTQKFVWKKKLTGSLANDANEQYNFKYLSRNLLVHSQKRAMLVNTAGHANFEIDFGYLFGV